MENIHVVGRNGDAIKNEEAKASSTKPEKKGFFRNLWDSLPDDAKVVVTIGVTAGGFIVACIAAGAVADTVQAANTRKTLNSDGFKHMIDKGLLDPVPPPKTLEEAAARIVASTPMMLPMAAMNIEEL